MTFKSHRYLMNQTDKSGSKLPLTDAGLPLITVSPDLMSEIVRRDFTRISTLALERIASTIPDDWLKECPHPILNQLLFHPTQAEALRSSLNTCFFQNLTENSPHSDSWWAIAVCPYPNGNPYTGKIDYGIMHLGWASCWMD